MTPRTTSKSSKWKIWLNSRSVIRVLHSLRIWTGVLTLLHCALMMAHMSCFSIMSKAVIRTRPAQLITETSCGHQTAVLLHGERRASGRKVKMAPTSTAVTGLTSQFSTACNWLLLVMILAKSTYSDIPRLRRVLNSSRGLDTAATLPRSVGTPKIRTFSQLVAMTLQWCNGSWTINELDCVNLHFKLFND